MTLWERIRYVAHCIEGKLPRHLSRQPQEPKGILRLHVRFLDPLALASESRQSHGYVNPAWTASSSVYTSIMKRASVTEQEQYTRGYMIDVPVLTQGLLGSQYETSGFTMSTLQPA
ncbi:hypothetical protein LY78DRAFT_676464 [Colletotrichum sublineola]|nr:hypothetical protein LY78DRAFT_676464 [Colletotrichum sublineola]